MQDPSYFDYLIPDLIDQYRSHAGEIMPVELLPIGGDVSRSRICLGLDGEYIGHVYHWEINGATIPPNYFNIYLIANTFEEFMNSLYLQSEDEED